MRTVLFILLASFFIVPSYAQYHSNHDIRDQDKYYYRYDRDRNNHESHYHNRQYNYNPGNRYLPIQARNELRDLERKLANRKKCAWEDGRISKREARRIRDVENDIAQLLYRYNNYGYSTRVNNRYCR